MDGKLARSELLRKNKGFSLNTRLLVRIILVSLIIFNPTILLAQNASAFQETHNFYFSKYFPNNSGAHLRIRLAFFGFDNFTHDISVGIFLTSSGNAQFEKLTDLSLSIERDNITLRTITKTDKELPDNAYYYGFRTGIYYESVITISVIVKGQFIINGVRQEITFNEMAIYQLKEAPFYRKYMWPIIGVAVILVSIVLAGNYIKSNKKAKKPVEKIDLTL